MRFLRRFVIGSFLLVAACSVLVVRQFLANQSEHAETREAFILLYNKGYSDQAQQLYQRLLLQLGEAPQKILIEDLQRTSTLVNPAEKQTENLIWKYHWSVSRELEKRIMTDLAKALKTVDSK